ncbi:MAG: DUF3368 domain-containing protein [Armatimonadetes bacterium]|nr:DUF3368 domain-containing protein [Armatimonadota bacterium]MDW8029562.1 DUF3368 domain-containing protein [Armatimonadota bacterium]
MKEPAVTNSTCLIGLERIGRLDILHQLFETVMIPPKVQEEFGKAVNWLVVIAPKNTVLVQVLSTIVDEGEAEAIALAKEQNCLLVLDDRKARHWAKSFGLRIIGTAGLLVRAKRQGIVEEVKPILENLKQSNFRLHPSLEREVLRLAGEE